MKRCLYRSKSASTVSGVPEVGLSEELQALSTDAPARAAASTSREGNSFIIEAAKGETLCSKVAPKDADCYQALRQTRHCCIYILIFTLLILLPLPSFPSCYVRIQS